MKDPLASVEGRTWLINCLFETPPEQIERACNIQLLNLLCADALPGNEAIDFRGCLKRLDDLIEFTKGSIERTYRANGASPDYSYCQFQTKMAILVTRMKQTFGVCYSPSAKADLEAGILAPFYDASEIFINGMLREDRNRRWGTCSSIPVLVTAIARKLGYPVRLALGKQHLYARWEGQGRVFNIEASNAMGMSVLPDEEYHKRSPFAQSDMPEEYEKSGYFFRSLTPAEEFACFMKDRVACLMDAARYDETFLWSARALQFAPDSPAFAVTAYGIADIALKHRLWIKHPEIKIRPGTDFHYDTADLMATKEVPLLMTIKGHKYESDGEIESAQIVYEDACRFNYQGNNEQRDLQRFLKKFNIPRKQGPLPRPRYLDHHPRFIMNDPPERQAEELRKMADHFAKHDEPLKARDALHDLYMFDPCDSEVFHRARALEKLPLFQKQFGVVYQQAKERMKKEGSTVGPHKLAMR